MDPGFSRRLVWSAMAGLAAAMTSCGGGTPEAATPSADKQETDKNSCGAGPNHQCGAHVPGGAAHGADAGMSKASK